MTPQNNKKYRQKKTMFQNCKSDKCKKKKEMFKIVKYSMKNQLHIINKQSVFYTQ